MPGVLRRPPYVDGETLAMRKFRELTANTIQQVGEITDALLPDSPDGTEDLGDSLNNLMIVYAIALGGC